MGHLQLLFITWSYNHVIKKCMIIGEHIVIIFVTQQVTIATVWPAKNAINYSFRGL